MARELNDAEYVNMLIGGNVSILWHALPKKWGFKEIDAAIKDAMYRALRQTFNDRLNIELPSERRDSFDDEAAGEQK